MATDGGHGRPADSPGETGPGTAARDQARPAWAKPAIRRFSLQRTLAGSSDASDVIREISAIPT